MGVLAGFRARTYDPSVMCRYAAALERSMGEAASRDPARAALLLAASLCAAVDGARAAIALVLVATAAFALRLLPAGQRLDGALSTVLVTAQLGAAAGLTETTVW
jgi:hypothetical protein